MVNSKSSGNHQLNLSCVKLHAEFEICLNQRIFTIYVLFVQIKRDPPAYTFVLRLCDVCFQRHFKRHSRTPISERPPAPLSTSWWRVWPRCFVSIWQLLQYFIVLLKICLRNTIRWVESLDRSLSSFYRHSLWYWTSFRESENVKDGKFRLLSGNASFVPRRRSFVDASPCGYNFANRKKSPEWQNIGASQEPRYKSFEKT